MKNNAFKRRILIVGEGRETEYNYFVGFRNAYEKQLEVTATSVRVARGKGGDSRRIVENAIKEAKQFKPKRNHGDRVFLLLDTEGPGSVPGMGREPELPAAEKLAEKNGIEIVYSCPCFEYWLLCHFEKIPRKFFENCDAVIAELDKSRRWRTVCNTSYDKSDLDIFARLSHFLDLARDQSLETDRHHLNVAGSARRANPSTQVYELIAKLTGVETGKKCPIAGTWKLLSDSRITIEIAKGEAMPLHNDSAAKWQLS